MFGVDGGGGTVRDDMVDKAVGCRKAGYRTALLTNNINEFPDVWRPMIPLDELFDVVVDSSRGRHAQARSPHLRARPRPARRAPPTRSVFLDDAPGNIAAAEALGMTGILVEDDHAAGARRARPPPGRGLRPSC